MAKKHKKQKKWISWLIVLILFVVAAAVAYLVWDAYFKDKKDDGDKGQTGGQTEVVVEREEIVTPEDEEEKPKIVQYDGEDPNSLEELSGVVTYAGLSGGNVMIRVNIDQYLEHGECELVLKQGGVDIYSDAAGIVNSAATATCEGFDVPVNDLGAEGSVEIEVKLNADGKSGVIQGEVSL